MIPFSCTKDCNTNDAPSDSNGLIQPLLDYNLPHGTYLTTSPVVRPEIRTESP